VAILAAMVPELRPVVRGLGLRRTPLGDGVGYQGFACGRDVVAATTSMGTRAATSVTRRVLDAFVVDHVIVVGIAGAIGPTLSIGDLLVPEVVVDEATGDEVHPVPIAGHGARGKLLTTDALHNDPTELVELIDRGFVAVDMETAAIGAVCEQRGVPWSVFRAISDRAGDPTVDQSVLGLAHDDGSADIVAVARFLVTRPWRVPALARLGRGMKAAVRSSTDATLAALPLV